MDSQSYSSSLSPNNHMRRQQVNSLENNIFSKSRKSLIRLTLSQIPDGLQLRFPKNDYLKVSNELTSQPRSYRGKSLQSPVSGIQSQRNSSQLDILDKKINEPTFVGHDIRQMSQSPPKKYNLFKDQANLQFSNGFELQPLQINEGQQSGSIIKLKQIKDNLKQRVHIEDKEFDRSIPKFQKIQISQDFSRGELNLITEQYQQQSRETTQIQNNQIPQIRRQSRDYIQKSLKGEQINQQFYDETSGDKQLVGEYTGFNKAFNQDQSQGQNLIGKEATDNFQNQIQSSQSPKKYINLKKNSKLQIRTDQSQCLLIKSVSTQELNVNSSNLKLPLIQPICAHTSRDAIFPANISLTYQDHIEQTPIKQSLQEINEGIEVSKVSQQRGSLSSVPEIYKQGLKFKLQILQNTNQQNQQRENKLINRIFNFSKRIKETLPGNKDIDDEFRLVHKNIDKLEEKYRYFCQPPNFLVNLISNMEKISLPPKKMNYLKNNKNWSVLTIDNFQLSAPQSDFFIKVISTEPYKSNLLVISANNNNINDEILENLLNKLPNKVENLALKSNTISNGGIVFIANKIKSNHCSLINIDLENNKIKDIGAKCIFKALLQNNTLSKLNLSQNMIGDLCATDLCELLEKQMTLQELYLKWNNFRAFGGVSIAKGLKNNKALRVLDISYNNIGSVQLNNNIEQKKLHQSQENDNSFGRWMEEALIHNKKLIHLDLSQCNLKDNDCKRIQTGLKRNKTLFGFHIENNCDYFIDQSGFMQKRCLMNLNEKGDQIPMDQSNNLQKSKSLSPTKLQNSPSTKGRNNNPLLNEQMDSQGLISNEFDIIRKSEGLQNSIQGVQYTQNSTYKMQTQNNCWLCQGWGQSLFKYENISQSTQEKIYIHFEFEGFRPREMKKNSKIQYEFLQVCPPNSTVYYFLSDSSSQTIIIDDKCEQQTLKNPLTITFCYEQSNQIQIQVEVLNYVQTAQENIFNTEYFHIIECSIRDD